MQSSIYNNPAFAQGLAGLVQSFIGNPNATAQNEESASRAYLNRQTAQYREAMGDAGLSGDLSSMMIRALQAGSQYSGNAPKIGDAVVRFGGVQAPQMSPVAAMVQSAVSQPAPTPAPTPALPPQQGPQPLSPQDVVTILNQAREAIASNKDPVAVAERLRQWGIDPSQL